MVSNDVIVAWGLDSAATDKMSESSMVAVVDVLALSGIEVDEKRA